MDTEPYPDEFFEESARREAEHKALKALDKLYDENGDALQQLAAIERKELLEALGIDYENFGQKPWDEDDLDYQAPNGDYIKSYPLINRVEVIGPNGREFVQYDCSNVQVSEQDNGRTLKVFLS